jgi:ABC-type bacteriocin/lantibiotic exporter with double-glycine peptidase domain
LRDISVVYFFTVTTMLIRVLASLGTVVGSGGRATIDIRAAFDINDIVSDRPTGAVTRPPGLAVTSVRDITLSGVSFGYLAGHSVLTDISGQLRAARCYALVGRSGSGKSTLSDVLLGHLRPTSGELWIGGESYEKMDLTSLRRRVVLVEQQTRMFSGTVRENIAFGLAVTDSEMRTAVDAAGLQDFLSALPDGLETRLDYQGANISGGQRQRIGLARAIVRQPDVLVLDEATSALDSQSRDMVVEHLRRIFRRGILVFITHDNNIIRTTDEVWHLKKGKLVVETREIAV